MRNLVFILILSAISSTLFAFEEEGYASWYAGKFHGRTTASGEVFDTLAFTAAHKTLPFGTIVRVTCTDNGKSVDVKINDRGPFVEGRIIDLSQAAAEALNITGAGIARVRIQTIEPAKPVERFFIQVGAFSKQENAQRLWQVLSENGLKPDFETTQAGIIRVVLNEVPASDLDAAKETLAALGYRSVLVRPHKPQ